MARNREMGRRLRTLAYYVYFNELPFMFSESFMPWFTLNKIDMGEVNHSREFIRHFARLVLFCRMSTFCISDINCVEVLTSRVSQETHGKENLFLFFFNAFKCDDYSMEV